MKPCTIFLSSLFLVSSSLSLLSQETLPPLTEGKIAQSVDDLWAGYDPKKEPLETEALKEWEENGIVLRIVRYHVGTFKGAPAKLAAFYGFPKGGTKLPAIIQIHGGGQSASLSAVTNAAKNGYACVSINWGGNKMGLSTGAWDGPQTDWGKLDCTHIPQRNKANHFAGPTTPDEYTLDSIDSPRNSNWFIVTLAARRTITFLENQPEVDPARIGATGHSMGGKLTTLLSAVDKRIKASAPSCGGAGSILESEPQVPGGIRRKVTDIELNCVIDNPYISKIACPVLWISPTNDFHAPIENMAWTWRNVPDDLLRLSVTPHMNHTHKDDHELTQSLWFEQHLKGTFTLPKTPKLDIQLKTSDGIPSAIITPDSSASIKSIFLYYSIDAHPLTRFWRTAPTTKEGNTWKASCPLMNLSQPLFAYADVIYEIGEQSLGSLPESIKKSAKQYALSSRLVSFSSAQLIADGVKATDRTNRIIDDGSHEWQDWFQNNWGHPPLWRVTTRKLKDPKWQGPNGAKLLFEMKPNKDVTLVAKITTNGWGAFLPGKPPVDYTAVKELKGSEDWQSISLSLEDFISNDPKHPEPLVTWSTVTEFSISPSGEIIKDGKTEKVGGKPWQDNRTIRNMRWEGGAYSETQNTSSTLNADDHQKQFNDAIKKSLEVEKVDAKK